jgi:hypothetical protein
MRGYAVVSLFDRAVRQMTMVAKSAMLQNGRNEGLNLRI